MNDLGWIDTTLTAARPQAMAALLRYFRDLDTAEEAFQEASLRALQRWPENGPPRNPAAWLIMVGRNFGVDEARRMRRLETLPDEEALPAADESEGLAERLDNSHYRDDILRLLFTCCHPDLPATQQIALALRVVSGLSVTEIASAFLVSESAMEQRITRAKRQLGNSRIEFSAPGAVERAERLGTVATMIYLLFNEGYSSSGDVQTQLRLQLCEEAIRLARLVLSLFPSEPEIMGLMALLLLQHARAPARLDAQGNIVLLEQQDRSLWNRRLIEEGLAMVDKALRHRRPGPYQVQAAIAALHARAALAEDTDWQEIAHLYALLETMQPSPVIALNRAVAVSKAQDAQTALALLEPLAEPLQNYFHYFGVKGALLKQLGRRDEARTAFDRAIALAHTLAEAEHIRSQLDQLQESG